MGKNEEKQEQMRKKGGKKRKKEEKKGGRKGRKKRRGKGGKKRGKKEGKGRKKGDKKGGKRPKMDFLKREKKSKMLPRKILLLPAPTGGQVLEQRPLEELFWEEGRGWRKGWDPLWIFKHSPKKSSIKHRGRAGKNSR